MSLGGILKLQMHRARSFSSFAMVPTSLLHCKNGLAVPKLSIYAHPSSTNITFALSTNFCMSLRLFQQHWKGRLQVYPTVGSHTDSVFAI